MIKFLKTNSFAVKSPKGNPGKDAGIDFFVPELTPEFQAVLKSENPSAQISVDEKTGEGSIVLAPHSDILINSGIYTRFDKNIAFIGFNKSGIATKKKLVVGACVDDTSYEGLLHLHVINTSDKEQVIKFGEKLVQFVPVLIDCSGFEVAHEDEVSLEEFFKDHNTDRGAGGFGSTGLK